MSSTPSKHPETPVHFKSPFNRAFFQPKARNRSEPLLADFLVGFVQSCDLAEEDGTGGILPLVKFDHLWLNHVGDI